jgi:hypothetical protein
LNLGFGHVGIELRLFPKEKILFARRKERQKKKTPLKDVETTFIENLGNFSSHYSFQSF